MKYFGNFLYGLTITILVTFFNGLTGYDKCQDPTPDYFFSSFISYTLKCILKNNKTGEVIAEGIGACNSRESKYRYQFVASDKKPSKNEAEELE